MILVITLRVKYENLVVKLINKKRKTIKRVHAKKSSMTKKGST